MPYIKVEACVCYRCHHVWLPGLLPGEKPATLNHLKWEAGKRSVPKCCAKCKDPNWNRRRQYHMRAGARKPRQSQEKNMANVKAMSGTEIFDAVMQTVKPKLKT